MHSKLDRSPIDTSDVGIYIHIPFCAKRCDYCDFATFTDINFLHESYVEHVITEFELRRDELKGARLRSVFLGGGTPSLLSPHLITQLISALNIDTSTEVTIECNPDDITNELVDSYLLAGINRLSMGVQSRSDKVLASLGRSHSNHNIENAARIVSTAGFFSWSMDLIYGAHGETLDDWKHTLTSTMESEHCPPHLSAYALIPEPTTPLGADVLRHPNDDDQADKYLVATDLLTGAGFSNYEISNWALSQEHESLHNWLYWSQNNYIGLGSSAHSHHNGRRSWNSKSPFKYVDLIDNLKTAEIGHELVEGATSKIEKLQLMLRTRLGIPSVYLDEYIIENNDGFLTNVGQQSFLTTRGKLVASEISMHILERPRQLSC